MADRESGVYATFETSMGRIICRLFEKEAPKTVENFVALADSWGGGSSWMAPPEGRLRGPFITS